MAERLSIELGLKISKSMLIRFLKSLGYTYRRIRKSLKGKPDAAEYEKKAIELAQLIKLEERNFLTIYFADEAGFSETPNVPYGWQPKGQPFCMPSQHGKRTNIFGMMSRNNELRAAMSDKSINSAFVIEQIDALAQDPMRAMDAVVVLDNAKIHHSLALQAKINEWAEQGVRIFYLPTYSPHLNAIETLWRKMKYEWLLPCHYLSWDTLKEQLLNIINTFGKEYQIDFQPI